MAYFSPYVDGTGMHIPLYQEIVDKLVEDMKQIFGDDIYLEADSQDYQQISIFARMIYDSYNLALLAYNNRTPKDAVGIGLDNIVALAGIQRKPATASTVVLTITGVDGTKISNGEVSDDNGNYWELPDEVIIPSNGIIDVTATSKEKGNVFALPNTITNINTPVYGWLSVTNKQASSAGIDVENDFELRGRFSLSVLGPSSSIFESLQESLAAIPGVTRVRGYENDTSATSTGTVPPNVPAGIPSHTVSFVVEGGDETDVATELYLKKTPGCGTFGTTNVSLLSITGNTFVINFYRPTYTDVKVKITIKELDGYTQDYVTKMKEAVSNYITEMSIAEVLYNSVLISVALEAMNSKNYPAYTVTKVECSTDDGSTWSTNDVNQVYYGAFTCSKSDVSVVSV
jgi:uncharacterized phage protein gp47/JayE